MVQWKGNLGSEIEGKAKRLDELENFYVPNFFVVTPAELKESVEQREKNSFSLTQDLIEELEDAYKDINVSSEVRNASGRARNLVGGQRNTSRVSVRVSSAKNGKFDYELNVGAGEIDDAVRKVLESYYREVDEGVPSILVQKMVEPEASGAVLKLRNGVLIEAVKGLGESLEEAQTVPDFYLPSRNEKRVPEKQLEASLNPMTGETRTKEVNRHSPLLKDSQIRQLAEKIRSEKYSVKFAYSRGSFYAVDAFEAPNLELPKNLSRPKVSKGELSKNAREVDRPEDPSQPTVASKGGFTSRPAERARLKGIPAVFSALKKEEDTENRSDASKEYSKTLRNESNHKLTATEVLEADESLPSRMEKREGIQFQKSYVDNAEDALMFEEDRIIVDARRMSKESVIRTLELYNTEFGCVILTEDQKNLVEYLVRQGIDSLAVDGDKAAVMDEVAKAERKMLLEASRKILEK